MRSTFAAILCLPLVLTGCALTGSDAPTADPGLAIQGAARGGQQPIVGARVYLFAASIGSYGAASTSLLNSSGSNTIQDKFGGATNNDYYVTTGAGGIFSISGDYSCTPETQVYLYIVSGDPGVGQGVNNSSGLLAALGDCPSGGNFLTQVPFIWANEVSTVAAAYSFAGFATDATHVSSSGTPLAQAGIKNAFSNAANLASISTGTALATTSGGATAPQATVYTLANILASCINSSGAVTGPTNATACYTLFNNAKSGGSTGAIPTDTATAAINIAHNPSANIATLFGLSSGTPPFGSALATLPNDFTLSLELTSPDMSSPRALAVDGSGNVWIANSTNASVTEFSGSGSRLSGSTGWTGGGVQFSNGIAIDQTGDVWVTNYTNAGTVSEFLSSGVPATGSPYAVTGLNHPFGIAVDGTGDVWVTNYVGNSISKLSSAGASLAVYNHGNTSPAINLSSPRGIAIDGSGNAWIASTGNSTIVELSNGGTVLTAGYTGGGVSTPYGIAIDSEGDAWIPNYGTSTSTTTVTELSNSRTPVAGSPFNEGGIYGPQAVAIDGSGNAWVADYDQNSVTELSSSGAQLSPSSAYTDNGNLNSPAAIAVDGSGNVWIANSGGSTVTELIGAGTPVVTPLAVGVKNNTLGTRP